MQRLRIKDAKRHLEQTDASAEEISWQVGYEDAAFFRRLFKWFTGSTPSAYRRRFQRRHSFGPVASKTLTLGHGP